jgi:hypothetical protein
MPLSEKKIFGFFNQLKTQSGLRRKPELTNEAPETPPRILPTRFKALWQEIQPKFSQTIFFIMYKMIAQCYCPIRRSSLTSYGFPRHLEKTM